MKNLILAALLIGAAAAHQAPSLEALGSYTFEDYVKAYGKTYATPEERAHREAAFNENLLMIRKHNANPTRSWRMNVNHMADWTVAERKGVLGGIPSAKNGLKAKDLPNLKAGAPAPESVTLPYSVDWRRSVPQVVSAVKNQGKCGSCWAHGAVETLESHYAIQTGNLFVMSQQQLTSCVPNPNHCGGTGGCAGSTANLAFEWVIQNGGITEDWQYGYTSFYGETGNCTAPTGSKNIAKFASYVNVPSNDRDATMQAVAQAGPLAVNVDASKWHFYASGVFDECSYTDNIDINHVVQLVGYGHDAGLGKDYWLIRNSWSASYGESGYIRLLREDSTVCGTDSTPSDGTGCNGGPSSVKACGQCGVLYEVSYPVPDLGDKVEKKAVRLA